MEILEKCFDDYPSIVTIEKTKIIINQIENSICKIYRNEGGHGTGFFCYIENKKGHEKSNEKVPVLITNNHIIGEDQIKHKQQLKISFNNGKRWENLNLDRNKKKIYTSKKYDITIIEIKKSEMDFNSFLEIDDRVYMEGFENIFQKIGVYTIQYPKDLTASVSYGIIKNINQKNEIIHYCHTREGSSGSPILNLENTSFLYLLISIKGLLRNYNKGTFLNAPIKAFFNNFSDDIEPILNKAVSINTEINNKYKYNPNEADPYFSQSVINPHGKSNLNKNEIKITLEIKDNQVNKEIYFLCNKKESNKVPNYLSELNSENTELIIGGNKLKYQQYFIPSKIGKYDIILKFKKYFKNCSYMFCSCKQIIRIDLSNFKTNEVTDMSYMFNFCTNLKNLDLSDLNTENVENMSHMFSNCSNLSVINTSSFNIKNVNNMKEMFLNCRNLTNIDFSSSIASGNLDTTNIFGGCWNFKKLKLNKYSKEKFQKEIKIIQEKLIDPDKKINIEYV